MEQGALLVEKEVDGYLPLGAFGQPVHRSYVQLRAAVAQRLSSRCANLFARPQYDERSRKIRWISPIAGEPRNWRNLEPQEQAERALDLQIIRGEFEGYLAELRGVDGNGGGEAFGSVLEQSLKTPNDGHLHFVGDQPVMTFWGFTELNGDAFDALTAVPPPDPAARTADTAAPIITGAEQGRRWWLPAWLLWLLLLLLLLLIFLLWWFFWDETDPLRKSPPDPAPVAEEPLSPRDEFRILPDQVGPSGRPVIVDRDGRVVDPDSLRIDGQGRVIGPDGRVIEGVTPNQLGLMPGEEGAETSTGPAPGPMTEPATSLGAEELAEPPAQGADPAKTEPEQPATSIEEGAGVPRIDESNPPEPTDATDPPALPADQANQIPPEQAAAGPGDPLTLPPPAPGTDIDSGAGENAVGSAPARFMRGEWLSRSALSDEKGMRLDQTYRFDENGKGQSIIRRTDGTECTAPAEARMESGRLRITEQGNPTCPDGQQFEKSETVCETDASGDTRCKGSGYNVQIEKTGQ